jgi:hypothetical protein
MALFHLPTCRSVTLSLSIGDFFVLGGQTQSAMLLFVAGARRRLELTVITGGSVVNTTA